MKDFKNNLSCNAFTLAEGRLACTTTQETAKGGQVHSYKDDVTCHEVAEPKNVKDLTS